MQSNLLFITKSPENQEIWCSFSCLQIIYLHLLMETSHSVKDSLGVYISLLDSTDYKFTENSLSLEVAFTGSRPIKKKSQ